jgi:hypothetical protein
LSIKVGFSLSGKGGENKIERRIGSRKGEYEEFEGESTPGSYIITK